MKKWIAMLLLVLLALPLAACAKKSQVKEIVSEEKKPSAQVGIEETANKLMKAIKYNNRNNIALLYLGDRHQLEFDYQDLFEEFTGIPLDKDQKEVVKLLNRTVGEFFFEVREVKDMKTQATVKVNVSSYYELESVVKEAFGKYMNDAIFYNKGQMPKEKVDELVYAPIKKAIEGRLYKSDPSPIELQMVKSADGWRVKQFNQNDLAKLTAGMSTLKSRFVK